MSDAECSIHFPDTFLDYIPDPPMGRDIYQQSLESSFENDDLGVHPIYALFKVTNRCNSKCAYCGHADVDKTEDFSSTQHKDILDQLSEVGCVSVNFTGGEPLLLHDLPELAIYANERGLFTILLTNGLLLQKRSDELRHSGLGMVIVSIDSVRPATHRKTRGADIGPVLKGLDTLLAYPKNERPVVTVTTVVSSRNIDHLDEVVSYFSERGVGVKLTPYHHHGRWEDDCLSPQDMDVYHNTMDKLAQMKKAGYGIINSQAYLDNFVNYNFNRNSPEGFRCYGGHTTLYIDPKLNVRTCWSAGLPIAGNLGQTRLNDLLHGAEMRQIRQNIRKRKCNKCWLLCTAEISLRFQSKLGVSNEK